MSAMSNDDLRRKGAIRCLEAMRQIENDAVERSPDDAEGFLLFPYATAEKLVKNMAPMPPETEGVIMALTEYFCYYHLAGGDPNMEPGHWKPVVTMTSDELARKIREAREADEDDKNPCQSNVIEFRKGA